MLAQPSDSAIQEFRRSWRALLAAALGLSVCVTGLPLYTIGVFVDPLSREFGWSRTDVSLWSLFLNGGLIVALLFVGRTLDKVGARRVALVSVPLLGAAIAAMSLVRGDIWTLYVAALIVPLLGGGASGPTYNRVINSWFSAGRGLALGAMASGIGFMSILGPRLLQSVVDRFGWRVGFLVVAAAVLSTFPVAYFFLYERRDVRASGAQPLAEEGMTRAQALRMPVFWLQAGCYGLFSLLTGAVIVSLISVLTDHGMSRGDAASHAGLFGLGSLTGRLAVGFLFDRLHAPFVCCGIFLLSAAAIVVLGTNAASHAPIAVFIIGLGLGTEVDALGYCTARYFGMRAFGEIFSLFSIVVAIGNGLGPFVMSRLTEVSGGYGVGFGALASASVAAAILMAFAGRYPFPFGVIAR